MPDSLGAFVVTYRRPRALQQSIEALLRQTRRPDVLLIVDNAGEERCAELAASYEADGVLYEATRDNLGSAGGSAHGTLRLVEMGVDLIYSGDDDNPPRTPDTIERILRLLAEAPPNVAGAGTVGARFNWRTGRIERLRDEELSGIVPVDFIGGDHKLTLRRQAVLEVGPPDEKLFFGYPDLEHCLRLRRAGWELRIDGELMREYRRLVGKLGTGTVRSPIPRRPRSAVWRHYYTTRNYVHFMRRGFERPDLARRETLRALTRSAGSWARGPGYGFDFTRLVLRGLLDGWLGRGGRRVMPAAKESH